MAITATIALTPSTIVAGNPKGVTAELTVSNSGSDDVTIRNVTPIAEVHGGSAASVCVASGVPPIGPGFNITVPAGGSLVIPWGVVAHGPTARGTNYYDIGAEVLTSDGSITRPTVATLTVTEPTH
jgi:hypothetical protein